MFHICKCGNRFSSDNPLCPKCGFTNCTKAPRWICLIQRLSKPEDIGLGATVKRIAAKVGGERFKAWAKRIGLPCGCTDREIEWNKLYPNHSYRSP